MNTTVTESSCTEVQDMLQAMKNDWGKPGETGKCLLTDLEMLREDVEEPTSTRNALKKEFQGSFMLQTSHTGTLDLD